MRFGLFSLKAWFFFFKSFSIINIYSSWTFFFFSFLVGFNPTEGRWHGEERWCGEQREGCWQPWRNTGRERNPYSENLLHPKNEVPALTSHQIQRVVDKLKDRWTESFDFFCSFGKEGKKQKLKVMDPMDIPFPILLWVEDRSPVSQQCCTSAHIPLWHKINANSFCRWEQPLSPGKNEIIFIFPTSIYSPPIFSLLPPSGLFPLNRQMISELVWLFFDNNQVSEPPHLSSCTEDEEMMGAWSSCVQSSSPHTWGEGKNDSKEGVN